VGHSAEIVLELFDLVEELVLLSIPVGVVVSSPRLVEGSTFASSDESDHDDGQGSPPEPLVLSELGVSPAAVESSVVGWVRKELSGNEHLGSLVSWLGVERVAEVHGGFFLRGDPLDWVLSERESIRSKSFSITSAEWLTNSRLSDVIEDL